MIDTSEFLQVSARIVSVFDIQWFGFSAWWICLATALVVLFAILKIRWARRVATESGGGTKIRAFTGVGLEYTDAPTVRVSDTQRIDRLHRIVSLKAGEQADLKDLTFGRIPRLQLAFSGVEHDSGQDYAHIRIELGGATADCGESVKELSDNDFLVPRASTNEQRSCILYFCGKSDAVSFLQVKVRRIDAAEQSAAIDVLHVRGRWAA
jgi:hypothetical protein